MTEDTTMILHEISALKDSMNEHFQKVDKRLDGVEQRLDGVEQRLDGVDQRLDGVEQRLDGVEALARGNRMILENDIPKQINLIAEGHMDLSRRLQAVEETNQKYDKVMINMVAMQNDIRKIKDRIGMA